MFFKCQLIRLAKLKQTTGQYRQQRLRNRLVRLGAFPLLLTVALIALYSQWTSVSIIAELRRARVSDVVLDPQFQHFLSACVIVRESSDLIGEFLIMNYAAGVDHFFIYDDDDDPVEKARIRKIFTALNGLVTYIPNGREAPTDDENPNYVQMRMYRHCLQEFGHRSKWVSLIDTDEFFDTFSLRFSLEPGRKISRRAFLHDVLSAHDIVPILCVRWKTALTNGRLQFPKQGETLSDLFPRTCKVQVNNKEKLALRKMILQPHFVDMKHSPKLDVAIHKGFSFTGQMKKLKCKSGLLHDLEPPIYLIHYWSRDLSSYLRKIRRGRPRRNSPPRNLGDLFLRESMCNLETNAGSSQVRTAYLRRLIRSLPFFPPSQELLAPAELAVGINYSNSSILLNKKRLSRLITEISFGKDFANGAYCKNRESEACSLHKRENYLSWPFPWAEYLTNFNELQNEDNLFI